MGTTASTNRDLIRTLNQMKQKFRKGTISLKTGGEQLSKGEAEELKDEIEKNYDLFINSLPKDRQDHTYYTTVLPRSDGGYDVLVTGSSVIYDEFGTGIVGAINPHPKKSSYGDELNKYNSGETIRHFPNNPGKDYWIYPSSGGYISTHGIPAGQFMYDSITNMIDGIWINNHYKEIFGDFYNDMKGK